jgi:hypothetical protein
LGYAAFFAAIANTSSHYLIAVIIGGITTEFEYNGDGDRVAQTVAGVTTEYVLDLVGLGVLYVGSVGQCAAAG